jgi:predicted component of type VI protein secretion system
MVESGPDKGKTFEIGPTMLVAGRQAGVDILLNDDQISRRHASFEEVNNALFLNDLGSANGTRLNGRTISANQPVSLTPGDRIQIGRTTLLVQGGQFGGDPFKTEVAGAIPPVPPINPAPAYSNAPAAAYPNANEPQGGYYQPPNQGYNSPAQPPAYNNNPNPYSAQPQQAYYPPQQPAPVARKKGSAVPIIIGVLAIIVVAAVAIGAIFFVSKGPTTATPTVQGSTTGTPGATQGPDQPIKQAMVGPSGSNGLPPAPPDPNAATPTPNPTTNPGAAGSTTALGISVKYPNDWKTSVDESKSVIESDAPDGITFSLIYRRSGLSGTAVDRLTAYLQNIEPNITNFTLTQQPKFTSPDNTIADAYVTFTDKDGKLLQRDYILATNNKAGDTYFIHFSTEDASFDSQISTFNSILQSIVIN